jgi:hypothetical protein
MADKIKRTTVYLDAETIQALKLKALIMEKSVSYLVNDAVKQLLAEDAEDLAAFDERAGEPEIDFEEVVKDLKRRGKI